MYFDKYVIRFKGRSFKRKCAKKLNPICSWKLQGKTIWLIAHYLKITNLGTCKNSRLAFKIQLMDTIIHLNSTWVSSILSYSCFGTCRREGRVLWYYKYFKATQIPYYSWCAVFFILDYLFGEWRSFIIIFVFAT